MAYSSTNKPFLVAPAVAGGANGSNKGGNIWVYRSADVIGTVVGSYYFADGFSEGMQVNDVVIVVDTTSMSVADAVVTAATAGYGATVTAGVAAGKVVATASTSGAVSYGVLPYSDTNILASFDLSVNSYAQLIVNNESNGSTASADVIVSNNSGSSNAYYGDFGINSSTFSGSGSFNIANAVYLTATSGDLAIGTLTAGMAVHFFAAGSTMDALAITSANVVQLGGVDAATTAAQSLRVKNIVAGTSNVAGADFTVKGSVGTGTGAGGKILLQTAPAGTTGTTQNALATGLTITAPAVGMQPSVVVGNQALATNATDGFLYITGGAGTPTGAPTAFTGMTPMYYDVTNNYLYFYNGGWKKSTVYA
jgi:hypothetical protein